MRVMGMVVVIDLLFGVLVMEAVVGLEEEVVKMKMEVVHTYHYPLYLTFHPYLPLFLTICSTGRQ